MNYLFYCGHPAHFHLLKNTINELYKKGHSIYIVIKAKDVLEDLVMDSKINYYKISNINSSIRIIKYLDSIIRIIKYAYFIRLHKFDVLIGTSWENSKLGYLLKIPTICLNEDDADIVPLFAKNAYPHASIILSPISCNNNEFEYKSIKYNSFHELAYLHPNHFKPQKEIVYKYIPNNEKYFILRFAKLNAHHDVDIKGIDISIAKKIIKILSVHGKVYITSERKLEKELEKYRITINPVDMHHILAYAELYIGDSQTMAAEAGVLGTPFIRYNDFVGRIGYLRELEEKYQLGFGIKSGQEELLMQIIKDIVIMPNTKEVFQERRKKMLKDKIDYSKFLTWFIENFPKSKQIMQKNPDYQFNFKGYVL